jgi:hypothetical protein
MDQGASDAWCVLFMLHQKICSYFIEVPIYCCPEKFQIVMLYHLGEEKKKFMLRSAQHKKRMAWIGVCVPIMVLSHNFPMPEYQNLSLVSGIAVAHVSDFCYFSFSITSVLLLRVSSILRPSFPRSVHEDLQKILELNNT